MSNWNGLERNEERGIADVKCGQCFQEAFYKGKQNQADSGREV